MADSDSSSGSSDLRASQPVESVTFLQRHSTLILCFALFLLPLISMGAIKAMKVEPSGIRQWLPSGFEEAKIHDWFVDQFDIDEMVVISWPGCTLDDARVPRFQAALQSAKNETGPLFSRVTTGPEMLAQIRSTGVSEKNSLKRVQGLLVGKNGKTTCVVAYPSKAMVERRKDLVSRIYETAEQEIEIPLEQLKLGGPTVDGATIDVESNRSLKQFLWISIVSVFLLTWFRMRDLPLTLLVLFFSVLCAALSLAILHFTGGKMNLTMIMLPTLTFILGVSGCVHMVNYYRKASTMGYGLGSADHAMREAAYPVTLSAITTAIGLFSLSVSRVGPIRLFGMYSAMGVLASLVIVLLVMPAALHLMKGRISRWFSSHGKMDKRERATGVSRSTSILINWVCRSHNLVVIPVLIGVTILALGAINLKASVKLQNRFHPKTKILQDYRWLEEHLGPLVPMEVVLNFPSESPLTMWQKMQMVKSVERAIKQTTAVNATLSVATFEPFMPTGARFTKRIERRARKDKWKKEFHSFEDAKLVKINDDHSLWRISLRVAALNEIDYGEFLDSVKLNVNHQLRDIGQPGVKAELTGGVPLVYKAQHQILKDLMISFMTAFLFISIVLIFVLKSFRAGMIAMIPNVFPPLVVFGAMGWIGHRIEIGSMMTASVALGIAVDDTIHFLTWYRRGTTEGLSRFKSIRYAFEHCAKAMIDTSLICGLGVAPFLFGVFMPTVNFAMLLTVMLMTALVGDLILLPAILAGPAGILFRMRKNSGTEKR